MHPISPSSTGLVLSKQLCVTRKKSHSQQVIGGQRPSPPGGFARSSLGRTGRQEPDLRRQGAGVEFARLKVKRSSGRSSGRSCEGSSEHRRQEAPEEMASLAAAGRAVPTRSWPGQRERGSSQEGPRTDRRWPEAVRKLACQRRNAWAGCRTGPELEWQLPRGRRQHKRRVETGPPTRAGGRRKGLRARPADASQTEAQLVGAREGTSDLSSRAEPGNARATEQPNGTDATPERARRNREGRRS